VISVAGCGAGVGDVSGTVTYKGAPLKGGTITLVNTSTGPSFSTGINEDGSYTLSKVVAGSYKVCVDTETLKPATATRAGAGSSGPGVPSSSGSSLGKGKGMLPMPGCGPDLQKKFEGKKMTPGEEGGAPKGYRDGFTVMAENAARYIKIPSKYAKPETTDLTFEAKSGSQTLPIELKD